MTYWLEYETPVQEPNGTWKSCATGRVRFIHDDGTPFIIEIETMNAYGQDEDQAAVGAKKRAAKLVDRIVGFLKEARNPT